VQYLLNLLSQGLLPETIFLNSVAVGIRKGFLFAASVNGLSIRGGGGNLVAVGELCGIRRWLLLVRFRLGIHGYGSAPLLGHP